MKSSPGATIRGAKHRLRAYDQLGPIDELVSVPRDQGTTLQQRFAGLRHAPDFAHTLKLIHVNAEGPYSLINATKCTNCDEPFVVEKIDYQKNLTRVHDAKANIVNSKIDLKYLKLSVDKVVIKRDKTNTGKRCLIVNIHSKQRAFPERIYLMLDELWQRAKTRQALEMFYQRQLHVSLDSLHGPIVFTPKSVVIDKSAFPKLLRVEW